VIGDPDGFKTRRRARIVEDDLQRRGRSLLKKEKKLPFLAASGWCLERSG